MLTQAVADLREKNPQMIPALKDTHNEVWVNAGNRSGKSKAWGLYFRGYVSGFNPLTAEPVPPNRVAWWVGITREANIYDHLPFIEEGLVAGTYDIDWADLVLTHKLTGSRIHFKSYEERPQTFQAAGVHLVLFDDEPPEKIYRECRIRATAGSVLQIRGTITPVNGLTWFFTKIYQPWKRGERPSLNIHKALTEHNYYLSREQIQEFLDTLEPWEQAIRLRGDFIPLGGKPVFSAERILALHDATTDPVSAGTIVDREGLARFEADETGTVRIWAPPEPCDQYVIGADVAEGVAGGDASSAQVVRRYCATGTHPMALVATLHTREEADVFGRQLALLGTYYNVADLIPEINGPGLLAVHLLLEANYPAIYRREKTSTGMLTVTEAFGWRTTEQTRPVMIAALAAAIRDASLDIPDAETVQELAMFVRKDNGKAEAQDGCHDDRVMALALAIMGHRSLPITLPEERPVVLSMPDQFIQHCLTGELPEDPWPC